MSPNVLELLSASPLVALGLALGGLVVAVLVVRALRGRRPEPRAPRTAASSAPGERRAARAPETQDGTSASARATVLPAPLAQPAAATAPAPEPASSKAAPAHDLAPARSADAPSAAELPPLPFDEAAPAPTQRAASAWFDAIPTPDVVEVAAADVGPETEPRATPGHDAFAAFDAAPAAAPPAADGTGAEAIGEATAVEALPPVESSVDEAAAFWPAADAGPAQNASPVAEAAPDEILPALTLAAPVVEDVAATAFEPVPEVPAALPEVESAPLEDVAAPPALEAAPPVVPAPVPAVEPPPVVSAPPVDAGPARVLVVDDSAVVRAKLRKVLEGGGHKVDVAKEGREALALLAAGRYALMVTDLEMPTMSGFELIAAVRASAGLAALPIVAITGHDDLEPYRQRLPGLAGLFRKPWIDGDLLAHVAGVLAATRSVSGPGAATSPEPQPLALA